MGQCCLKTFCKGQAVISLSSAESEYYALVSMIAQLFGLRSLMSDWGMAFKVRVRMDATAGMAMANRRGLGKVKHVSTVFLWCQHQVTSGNVELKKVGTQEMLADCLTKPLPGVRITQLVNRMGFVYMSGRHKLARGST